MLSVNRWRPLSETTKLMVSSSGFSESELERRTGLGCHQWKLLLEMTVGR